MTGMTSKEILRIVKHIEPQGVTVTRTKKALLLRLPDGTATTLHLTTSDHRAAANARARLRRSGVTWPGDAHPSPLPPSITEAKLQRATIELARETLNKLDNPMVLTVKEMTRALPDNKGCGPLTVPRMLYHSGYRPNGKRGNAVLWERELTDAEANAMFAPEDQELPQLRIVENIEDEPAVNTDADGREFIDSVDSRVMDLDTLDPALTVSQLRQVLAAAGLRMEVRTWTPST